MWIATNITFLAGLGLGSFIVGYLTCGWFTMARIADIESHNITLVNELSELRKQKIKVKRVYAKVKKEKINE